MSISLLVAQFSVFFHLQQSSPRINKGKQPMKRQGGGHQRSKSELSFLKSHQQQHLNTPPTNTELSSSLPDNDSCMGKRMKNASNYPHNSKFV